MKVSLAVLIVVCIFTGCGQNTGVSQQKYNQVVDSLKMVRVELYKCKFGEAPPSTPTSTDALDLGIWTIEHYVDEFKEPTGQGYLSARLNGTFSNVIVENKKLIVNILITDSMSMDIMLYEYAGNNPVKGFASEYITDSYTIGILDNNKNRTKLSSVNSADRLHLNKINSKKLQSILNKEGEIKFHIIKDQSPTSIYTFTLPANGYKNAYRKLIQEKLKNNQKNQ